MRVLTEKKLRKLLHESYTTGLNVGYSMYKLAAVSRPRGFIVSAKVDQQIEEILRKED